MVVNTLLGFYCMDQASIPLRNIKPTVWLESGSSWWSLNVWVMTLHLFQEMYGGHTHWADIRRQYYHAASFLEHVKDIQVSPKYLSLGEFLLCPSITFVVSTFLFLVGKVIPCSLVSSDSLPRPEVCANDKGQLENLSLPPHQSDMYRNGPEPQLCQNPLRTISSHCMLK